MGLIKTKQKTKRMKEPIVTVEKITPAIASEWLEHNLPTNRAITQRHVERLLKDLEKGLWKMDGHPYRFDKDGNLLDGQHRLLAISKSGKTVMGVVVRGLERDAFYSMDTGRKRSTGDTLHIAGETNASLLAGGLMVIAQYLRDGTIDTNVLPSTSELVDVLSTVPKIRESVRIVLASQNLARARTGANKQLLPPALAVGLHCMFDEKDAPLADELVRGMCTGFDPDKRPVFCLLRERMMGNRLAKAKLPRTIVAAMTIKAWNAERAKTPLKMLRVGAGEAFPEIK